MELKIYARILLRRWWVLLAGFLVVFAAVWYWTSQQPFVYEAKTTLVIRPRTDLAVDDEYVRTLDLVSRRAEINATFSEVAGSGTIHSLAVERLQLPREKQRGLSVSARIIGGTNILEITVQGRDPLVVKDFANVVGAETVRYVRNLYDIFELGLLDEAKLPNSPVKPTMSLNLSLGAMLGLALGVGLVFLLTYLDAPHDEKRTFNIIDRDTGAYTKSYLLHRLGQEMSRARRNQYPLSLALIKIAAGNQGHEHASLHQEEALRWVAVLVEKSLREEDLISRLDEQTLAVLLPDMTERQAKAFVDSTEPLIAAVPQEVSGRHTLTISAGVIAYHNRWLEQTRFLEEATGSLAQEGKIIHEAEISPAAEPLTEAVAPNGWGTSTTRYFKLNGWRRREESE